jgi:tRNA-2-methylthio-N6-dimethylallyladenosine synthase
VEEFRLLVGSLRAGVPGIAVSTDVIVGFPGETASEFARSVALLSELELDTVHVAAYSSRPGTLAFSTMADDVSSAEKARRLQVVESMQESISAEKNAILRGSVVEVLVERVVRGKWEGRTRDNKLVFFSDTSDLKGRTVDVEILAASPWSLQGKISQEIKTGAK